jgi:orotate phosphoribosyltransferase
MSDSGFDVAENVTGKKLLLLDDVYTTGSRSQSAASALTAAGANIVGIMVIGRRVNPDYSEDAMRVWARQSAVPFRFQDLFIS